MLETADRIQVKALYSGEEDMTRRDIRDRIFKIVFTLEFNDAEGMQDQLDFCI